MAGAYTPTISTIRTRWDRLVASIFVMNMGAVDFHCAVADREIMRNDLVGMAGDTSVQNLWVRRHALL